MTIKVLMSMWHTISGILSNKSPICPFNYNLAIIIIRIEKDFQIDSSE